MITTAVFNYSVFERSLETKNLKKISAETGKKSLINFHSNQDPFLNFFFSSGEGTGQRDVVGNKVIIVFVKLFSFDSDLYLVIEGRAFCIKWKKPVVRV